MTSPDLFVDLCGSVCVGQSKQCRDCGAWKHVGNFYAAGSATVSRCVPCYERYWKTWNDRRKHWPVEESIARKAQAANARSRYRGSVGPPLRADAALALWKQCGGRCARCATPLTFAWTPRALNPNHAEIDRVRTDRNESYGVPGNAQFMCHVCNTEKGAWDLLAQKDAEIARLQSELRASRAALKS